MHTIQLTSGTWSQSIDIPSRWDEVPGRLLRRALRTAMSGRDRHTVCLSLLQLFGIRKDMLYRMDAPSVTALAAQLQWVHDPSPVMPFKEVNHAGMVLHLPGDAFEHGTCLEWALAEEYYEAATKGDEPSLLLLCATILRPVQGNERTRIIDRKDIERHARALSNLPQEIIIATMLYMAGVKKSVHDTYNEWLFKKPVDDDDATPSGPDFGWWGTYLSIAESQVFGDYEKVLTTNFHTVCVYLVQKKREADEARRRSTPNAIAL